MLINVNWNIIKNSQIPIVIWVSCWKTPTGKSHLLQQPTQKTIKCPRTRILDNQWKQFKSIVKIKTNMAYVKFVKSARTAGFHFIITFSKPFRETNSLIWVEISSQIQGPKIWNVSVPFTIGHLKVFWCPKIIYFLREI